MINALLLSLTLMPGRVVVVGDSLMCLMAPKIELRLGKKVIQECKVGSGIRHWTHPRLESDLMFVEIGTNDHGLKPEAYRKLVRNFLATANSKKIIWIGIPPMQGKLGEETRALEKILVEELGNDPRVVWVKPPVLGPGTRTPDHIHLTNRGTIDMVNSLPISSPIFP